MLRERFDRIEIIDLRGDVRTGERAGVDADQGVFNIMVGTAITVAIADGSKARGELAEVFYQDCWAEGLFSRRAKLDWLVNRADAGTQSDPVDVVRGVLDDMRPMPFQRGEWIGLDSCFEFRRSGVQTKRDYFVYSPDRNILALRLTEFRGMSDDAAREAFAATASRPWSVARAQPVTEGLIQQVAYRPLDLRWLYNHPNFIDRPRPELQQVWGNSNGCLYAMPSGTGAGPAVWCHGLLPDYHAFSGRGGYAFPRHDRRPEVNRTNVSESLITSLSAAYGEPILAEDVFDAILCLLSAASYTRRFAEDLEDVFPHVPFPARYAVFQETVRIGREIRAVESFARPPGQAYRQANFVRVATEPRGALATVEYDDDTITLCEDGSGRITGIPQRVWDFSVSGYRLLPRWLEARVGLPADLGLVRELRDICGRIAELIDLFAAADIVLDATLHESLTREALGLGLGEQQANDG